MARFSNHSEGEAYWAKYCHHCVHGGSLETGEPRPCAIWGLHLMFNGKDDVQPFLDALIPQAGVEKLECELFHPNKDALADRVKGLAEHGQALEQRYAAMAEESEALSRRYEASCKELLEAQQKLEATEDELREIQHKPVDRSEGDGRG